MSFLYSSQRYYCQVLNNSKLIMNILNSLKEAAKESTQKIITSTPAKNNRVLNLCSKFEEGCLIDINGTLWSYKKGRGYNNIIGEKSIISNTKTNFSQLARVKELQLHHSLTDKSIAGRLVKFYE